MEGASEFAQVRCLRSRSVCLAPAVSEKTASNSNTHINPPSNGSGGPLRLKPSSKRSAVDGTLTLATQKVRRKRTALGNLTNCSNLPPVAAASKPLEATKTTEPIKQSQDSASIGKKAVEIVENGASSDLSPSNENTQQPCLNLPLPLEIPNCSQKAAFDLPISNDDSKSQSKKVTKNYIDIDTHKDPQMCSAYASEIYDHLRVSEQKRQPSKNFLEVIQKDINANMRSILVDWLVEVAEEYKLVPDTLYLSVSYIDRYLSGNPVPRQRLQLLGVTCMLIASKYEEICPPQVEEFCYITDNTYSREELLEMEILVLNHLHFELSGPTIKSFLRRYVQAAQASQKVPTLELEFLANYLAELTLLDYSCLKYLPSMVASAAVFLAKLTLDPLSEPWNSTLQHYTGYHPSELKECVESLLELQRSTRCGGLPAIREKYRQLKFKCVASHNPPDSLPRCMHKDTKEQ